MSFRLVEKGWSAELTTAMRRHAGAVRIMLPFIKRDALQRLLAARSPHGLRIITRFNLDDFAAGVSDTAALRLAIKAGAKTRGSSTSDGLDWEYATRVIGERDLYDFLRTPW
jgi:hypothetical protein